MNDRTPSKTQDITPAKSSFRIFVEALALAVLLVLPVLAFLELTDLNWAFGLFIAPAILLVIGVWRNRGSGAQG